MREIAIGAELEIVGCWVRRMGAEGCGERSNMLSLSSFSADGDEDVRLL